MHIHAGLQKAIGLLVALAGCVALTAQPGCSGDGSPTAPPEPELVPVISDAVLTFMVTNAPTEEGPPGEILFDGRPIWAGQVMAAYVGSYYSGNAGVIFSQVLKLDLASLAPGVHTLTFRVSGKKATDVSLSGWIHLIWVPGGAMQVASWQDQTAWLKTGAEWTYQVVIPASNG